MFSFETIATQPRVIRLLKEQVQHNRIPHAQLFIGKPHSDVLPICLAYAWMLLQEGYVKTLVGHPDIHFTFPIFSKTDKQTICADFLQHWQQFISETPNGGLDQWHYLIGSGTKQTQIGVAEANEIIRFAALKPLNQKARKVIFIWGLDYMNATATNKLLKILEEPPLGTCFVLMAEDEKQLLKTIRSRCQIIRLDNPPIPFQSTTADQQTFESYFVSLVRLAFLCAKKKEPFKQLIDLSETLAQLSRVQQKNFLVYAQELFRQAFLNHYKITNLVTYQPEEDFNFEMFSQQIGAHNIFLITELLDKAHHSIERNGHAKIIFNNLCINLSKCLVKK